MPVNAAPSSGPLLPARDTTAPPPSAITDAIAQSAIGPRSASGDSGSVTQHSLPDQIAAAKFAASNSAMQRRGRVFRTIGLRPGNSADLNRGRHE